MNLNPSPKPMADAAQTLPTRILVVEDDAKIADMLTNYLQAQGFATDWCADGLQALMALADNDLLDLLLSRKQPHDLKDEPCDTPEVHEVLALMRVTRH